MLLGPGVILRLAENSVLTMRSSSLADARLEILSGTAILNAKDPLPGNSLALLYKDWEVRVPKQGVYRIDTDPQQLRVYFGEVEVHAAQAASVLVKAGQTLPLAAVLVPDLTLGPPGDEFNRWAYDRGEAIAADNATAAQIVDDPALYPLPTLSGLSRRLYLLPTHHSGYPSYRIWRIRLWRVRYLRLRRVRHRESLLEAISLRASVKVSRTRIVRCIRAYRVSLRRRRRTCAFPAGAPFLVLVFTPHHCRAECRSCPTARTPSFVRAALLLTSRSIVALPPMDFQRRQAGLRIHPHFDAAELPSFS